MAVKLVELRLWFGNSEYIRIRIPLPRVTALQKGDQFEVKPGEGVGMVIAGAPFALNSEAYGNWTIFVAPEYQDPDQISEGLDTYNTVAELVPVSV